MKESNGENERLAGERFRRFQDRSEVIDVTDRYADWITTSEGIMINIQLSSLAMMLVSRRMSRQIYRRAVADIGEKSGIPRDDFRIIARCAFELVSCALAGSGQIAFDPTTWDSERFDV